MWASSLIRRRTADPILETAAAVEAVEEELQAKREFEQLQAAADKLLTWPSQYFQNFVVVGLAPNTDLANIAIELIQAQRAGNRQELRYNPQVLYSYPEGRPLGDLEQLLRGMCFPKGVVPRLLRRSSSMSGMQDLLAAHQAATAHEDHFYVFVFKANDNFPMYCVCCMVLEMVHRPPRLAQHKYPQCKAPLTKFMVAAPRCYCLLSHYPFFDLHTQILRYLVDSEQALRKAALQSELPPAASTPPPPSLAPIPATPPSATAERDAGPFGRAGDGGVEGGVGEGPSGAHGLGAGGEAAAGAGAGGRRGHPLAYSASFIGGHTVCASCLDEIYNGVQEAERQHSDAPGGVMAAMHSLVRRWRRSRGASLDDDIDVSSTDTPADVPPPPTGPRCEVCNKVIVDATPPHTPPSTPEPGAAPTPDPSASHPHHHGPPQRAATHPAAQDPAHAHARRLAYNSTAGPTPTSAAPDHTPDSTATTTASHRALMLRRCNASRMSDGTAAPSTTFDPENPLSTLSTTGAAPSSASTTPRGAHTPRDPTPPRRISAPGSLQGDPTPPAPPPRHAASESGTATTPTATTPTYQERWKAAMSSLMPSSGTPRGAGIFSSSAASSSPPPPASNAISAANPAAAAGSSSSSGPTATGNAAAENPYVRSFLDLLSTVHRGHTPSPDHTSPHAPATSPSAAHTARAWLPGGGGSTGGAAPMDSPQKGSGLAAVAAAMFPNLHLYRDAPTHQDSGAADADSQGAHITGAPSEQLPPTSSLAAARPLRSTVSDPTPATAPPPTSLPTTPSFSALLQQAAQQVAAFTRARTPPPPPSPDSPSPRGGATPGPDRAASPPPPLRSTPPHPSPGLQPHPDTPTATDQPGTTLSLSPLIRVADLADDRLTHLQAIYPPLSPRTTPATPSATTPATTPYTSSAPPRAPSSRIPHAPHPPPATASNPIAAATGAARSISTPHNSSLPRSNSTPRSASGAPTAASAAAAPAAASERGAPVRTPPLRRNSSGSIPDRGGLPIAAGTSSSGGTRSRADRPTANGTPPTGRSLSRSGSGKGGSRGATGGHGGVGASRRGSSGGTDTGGNSGGTSGGRAQGTLTRRRSGGRQSGEHERGQQEQGQGQQQGRGVGEAEEEGGGGEGAPHMTVLSELLEQPVLRPGQAVRFQPYDIAVRGYEPPAIEYRRPLLALQFAERGMMRYCLQYADEELAASLQDSTIGLLCRHVSLPNILALLSAALLEQRLILMCPQLGLLTATTLALVPLLRPFRWPHTIMTVLPASLGNVLTAPFPVILGVNLAHLADLPASPYAQQMDAGELVEAQQHWVVLNVHANTLTCGPHAAQLSRLSLPGTAALQAKLQRPYAVLHADPPQQPPGVRRTYSLSHSERLEAAREMAGAVRSHLDELMQGVYACSIKKANTETRVVLKEQLAATFSAPKEAAWMAAFTATTLFDAHADELLRNA